MSEKKEKKPFYNTNSITILLIAAGFTVVYSIVYLIFVKNGDKNSADAFGVVTGLSGVVISIGTVFYVIKAYETQNEQIRIQKKEIEDTKRDVEYNRAIDIVYKQLEVTKENWRKHKEKKLDIDITDNLGVTTKESIDTWELFKIISNGSAFERNGGKIFNLFNTEDYGSVIRSLRKELYVITDLLDTLNLSKEKKDFITKSIVINNLDYDLVDVIGTFQQGYRNFKKNPNFLTSDSINSLECSLLYILSVLDIPQLEDLDLGE